jgi:hypothetical protein
MNTSATPSAAHTPSADESPSPAAVYDTLGEDVRSSLLLLAATGTFAFAVAALGSLAAGIPG